MEKARRINPEGALLPKLTDALMDEMAQEIRDSVTEGLENDRVKWDYLRNGTKAIWVVAAHRAYAVMAVYGGGKVEPLKEDK